MGSSHHQTRSEQLVAELCQQTFLRLWSFPSPHRDQGHTGSGKELCDLLAVCDDDVLIFSVKEVAWSEDKPLKVAWRRWHKRAVEKATQQILGAERWIRRYPDRIFLDRALDRALPAPLPPSNRMRIHRIVVALGCGEACKQHFGDGIGSLLQLPLGPGPSAVPFSTDGLLPTGEFVHVLDDATLHLVLGELDTVTDLTEYLRRKERFIRSGHLVAAHGEEDLLGYYLTRTNSEGLHDFVLPDGSPFAEQDRMVLSAGHYEQLATHPGYQRKKQADQVSYLWDALVDHLAKASIDQQISWGPGDKERAIREMARVPRVKRRMYAQRIEHALEAGREGRCTQTMLDPDEKVCFLFTTLERPQGVAYEKYRNARMQLLQACGLSALEEFRYLERVIGIASEPRAQQGGGRPVSEDLLYLHQPVWTPDALAWLAEARSHFRLGETARYVDGSTKEYPD